MNELLSFKVRNDDCDFKRIKSVQNKMYNRKATVCAERAEIITRVFKETESESMVLRKAKAFAAVLNEMTIYIEADMLISGNQASSNFAAPIFPEYSFNWLIDELDELHLRSGDSFTISNDVKSRLRKLKPYWENNTHQDVVLKLVNISQD